MHFDTESCDILLLEFASKVALDEGGLQGIMLVRTSHYRVKRFGDGGGEGRIKSNGRKASCAER